jgi:hypothetical protein
MANPKIFTLLNAMEKLMAVVQEETGLLKTRRYKEAAALFSKKQELASEYERHSAALRGNPDLFKNLDASAVDRLKNVAGDFQTSLNANLQTLSAARDAGNRLVNAIRQTVMEEESRHLAYAKPLADGDVKRGTRDDRPISMNLNERF